VAASASVGPSDRLETVASASLLRVLGARERAELSLAGRAHVLPQGATLFAAGAPADALFVVVRGRLRLEGPVDPSSVEAGDLFGWDAVVPGGVRSSGARVSEAASVVELPLASLRRALARSGAEELLAREERRHRLRAFRALLADTVLGAALGERELDRMVLESRERVLAPGEALGEPSSPPGTWLVVSGLVALDAGTRGYASRGRLVGFERALGGPGACTTATALGDVVVLLLPDERLEDARRLHPEAAAEELASSRRLAERQRRLFGARDPPTETDDPFGRLEAASSLLVIDAAACVDCGHCVRACADTHGTARFARHGERVTATVVADGVASQRAFLLPNACQHCKEAACLAECPTGALVREASGAVGIRADLCTGCGACASACPWDAVRLVPSGAGAVAVKCDLCSGRDGPACVLACPTAAMTRVDPGRDFVELRVAVGARAVSRAKRSALGPWLARAAVLPFLAAALALSGQATASVRFAAGVASGVVLAVLAAHAVVKRVPGAREAAGRALRRVLSEPASLSPLVSLHSSLGVLSFAAVLVHTGGRFGSGVALALTLAYALLLGTGVVGAALYGLLPRRLARLEPGREPMPEAEELERRLFAAISGGNDAIRVLARTFLIPHARSSLGALALLCSRRTPADEERSLAARVQTALGGRTSARLGAYEVLVRAAVAIRVERATRFGRALLRAFVPVHLILALLLVALLVLHVAGALR
jgi:Fe-S-cluster-containing dehydrogenase component/CRP-like cAMP-binding protein